MDCKEGRLRFSILAVAVILVVVAWSASVSAMPRIASQAVSPNATPASLTYKAFMPAVYRPGKMRSGIHVGNRGSDWNQPLDFLARLRGTDGGYYPAAVVVLSDQLYTIHRSTQGMCDVTSATIRTPYLFGYLTKAIARGTHIVIRVYPSPGNFEDAANPAKPHTLLSTSAPVGGTYCNGSFQRYRSVNDIAREIKAVLDVNVQQGWPVGSFYFEPANEPNSEWYPSTKSPNASNASAWRAMDNYFANLYDAVKQIEPQARVLTPPMAQGYYAEGRASRSCQKMYVDEGIAGYDLMHRTYEVKNDGFSWHNYWRQSKEFWSTAWPVCPTETSPVTSDHIYQYFPQWLQDTIAFSPDRLAVISEADLLSPCQAPNSVTNKDSQAQATQESIWRFIDEDRGADVYAVWLLTNEYGDWSGPGVICTNHNQEIAWHEGIRDGNGEREWFRLWWLRSEE